MAEDDKEQVKKQIDEMFGADDSDESDGEDIKIGSGNTEVTADASGLFGSDSESDEDERPTKRLKGASKKSIKNEQNSPIKSRKPEGDEYDSGDEAVKTKEDDDFIDDDDDNAELLKEYDQDNQVFLDERPDGVSDDEEKAIKHENFFDETIASMKSGRRRGGKLSLSAADLERLAQEVLYKMDKAWGDDQAAIKDGKPALEKIKFLDTAVSIFSKVQFQATLLDYDLLGIIKKWIEPSEEGTLPNVGIRTKLLKVVRKLPVHKDHLKRSGLGKVVMALWKHPSETQENKDMCREMVERWSRSVFEKTLNYRQLAELEAEKMAARAYRRNSARRSSKSSSENADVPLNVSNSDRVRIPRQMALDFHTRPAPKFDPSNQRSTKLDPTSNKGKLSKRMQNISRPARKNVRAVKMSIEGR